MYRDELAKLSKEELIALVLAQAAQIEELTRRIAELEAKLGGPPKTPDNSSMPPSQARKPNRAERRAAKKRKGHPGVFRALAANPDRIVESVADRCPHCEHVLTPADQPGFHAYDHLDLPPIRPVITRIHRHRGVCPSCRRGFSAPAPDGMAPGSPFGPDLIALILHLHVTQAIGFERLVRLLDEVFGVRISEGAIANMLARAGAPLTAAAETTAAEVRSSKVVASDETSARVEGKNWWQWVLLSSTAVYHLIAAQPRRGGGERFPRRGHARGLGRRPLRRTSRAWHRAPGLPRPSVARRPIRHRRRRCHFRRRLSKAAVARHRYWSAPRRSEGHHLGSVSRRSRPSARPVARRQPHRRPAANSPAASPNAAAISLSSSLDAMFPTPTTGANVRCGPASSFAKSPAGSDPTGAPASMPTFSVIATGRLNGRSALQAIRDTLAGQPILIPP